jgi:hypothetical protein
MRIQEKCFLFLCLQLTAFRIFSQTTVEDQMVKPVIRCEDIYQNAIGVIPRLYKTQPIDSVIRAVTIMEEKCGVSEISQRIKILIAIRNRNFSERVYDSTIMRYIGEYNSLTTFIRDHRSWQNQKNENIQKLIAFNEFTKQLATDLLMVADSTKLEYFFCSLYADKPDAMSILKDPRFSNSLLARQNVKQEKIFKRFPNMHSAVLVGLWSPTGNASLLGNHPILGLQIGSKTLKNMFDLTLAFKFINSPNTYQILRKGVLVNTHHFFGGYIGIDYAREISRAKNHIVEVLAGTGLDGFDVYETKDDPQNDMKPLSIFSYNFNGGLQYSLFINNSNYIGLQAKYNLVNYYNRGGTNLKGNAFTVSLLFGGLNRR